MTSTVKKKKMEMHKCAHERVRKNDREKQNIDKNTRTHTLIYTKIQTIPRPNRANSAENLFRCTYIYVAEPNDTVRPFRKKKQSQLFYIDRFFSNSLFL